MCYVKLFSPRRSRSSFSGTARSRHPVGANGLPCPSPSPWQTAGGRWEPKPLITHSEARSSWRLSDSTTDCQSLALFMYLFLSSLLLRSSGASPWCLFFSVFLAIHVYLTCPPIRVAFGFINVTHPQPFFSVSLFSFFFPLKAKSIVIHSSQSLNMIYCNMIISLSLTLIISLSTGQTTYRLQYQNYHSLLCFSSQTTSRFLPHVAIETEAVLSLDEDTVLLTSEVRVCVCVHVLVKSTAELHTYKNQYSWRKLEMLHVWFL